MSDLARKMRLRRKGYSLQKLLLVAAWVSLTSALFSWAYFRYHHEPRYFYTRQILGQWLCVSRGTAAVLHLCMACVVFPVSRFLHLMIARLSVPKRMPKITSLFLMHMRKLHLFCAFTLLAASVVHTISHVVNAYNFSTHYNYDYPEVNWGKPGQGAFSLVFTSVVGLSGMGMMMILALMAYTSMEKVRNPHYNYFWLSHHLAWALLALYLIHPFSKVIKEISNVDQHNAVLCSLSQHMQMNISLASPCKTPIFEAPQSSAWKWLIFPFALMCLDAILKVTSQFKETTIASVSALPGLAVEIYLHCSNFSCLPGQYVLLQVPSISALEWHPFTVVKCPSSKDKKFSVIMKARGDWTRNCSKKLVNHFILPSDGTIKCCNSTSEVMRLRICGPFASPMEQVITCKNAVCIGAGVGITPFMSHIRHFLLDGGNTQIEQLKFIWLCPDASQLLWFAWTLSSLHNKCWEENKPEVFNFAIYVTKTEGLECVERILKDKYPLVAQRIKRGRPQWEELFNDIKSEFCGKNLVNIFGCGSKSMLEQLNQQTMSISTSKNKFVLIREAYS